jgi:hypothetical protein
MVRRRISENYCDQLRSIVSYKLYLYAYFTSNGVFLVVIVFIRTILTAKSSFVSHSLYNNDPQNIHIKLKIEYNEPH